MRRIYKVGYRFFKPGDPQPEALAESKAKDKNPVHKLTAAENRKIAELKKRIEEQNRARLNTLPKGAEIRG